MRSIRFLATLALVTLLAGGAEAQSSPAAPPVANASNQPHPEMPAEFRAPISLFIEGFQNRDAAKIAAAHAPSPTIIDEFAPFVWTGPSALLAWGTDLQKYMGGSNVSVRFDPPRYEMMHGENGYVILGSIITVKTSSQVYRSAGTFTLALTKTEKGWLIKAWAYTAVPEF